MGWWHLREKKKEWVDFSIWIALHPPLTATRAEPTSGINLSLSACVRLSLSASLSLCLPPPPKKNLADLA